MRIEVLGEEAVPGGPAGLSGRLLALVGALCPCQAVGPEHVSPSEPGASVSGASLRQLFPSWPPHPVFFGSENSYKCLFSVVFEIGRLPPHSPKDHHIPLVFQSLKVAFCLALHTGFVFAFASVF